jgi:hypothetical protein
MSPEENRKYKRDWMNEFRKGKKRIFIRVEGEGYKYIEKYEPISPDMPVKCPYCTMFLNSDYHAEHPCQQYEVVMILFHEEELN